MAPSDAAPQASQPAAELFQRAARAIHEADFLLVAAGAGMSADSGLPTFGTLTQHLGSALQGLSYDQAAGSDTMFKDPSLFYGFWFTSMTSYASAQPHAGYGLVQRWLQAKEARRPGSGFVLTSNVDGLFRRSGVAVVGEIHGSVARWQCGGAASGKRFPLQGRQRCGDELFAPPEADGLDRDAMRWRAEPPRCPRCEAGWLRPHVFLFGDGRRFVEDREALGLSAFEAWREATLAALRRDEGLRLVVLEVGCGLRVPNLRKRCEELCAAAPEGQGELLRVNPEFEGQAMVKGPSVALRAGGLEALLRIEEELQSLC